jgi:hypothetical protein
MQVLAILLTVASGITAFVGRIKASPLVPSYAAKFHAIHDALKKGFWSLAELVQYLKVEVETNGGISGSRANPNTFLLIRLQTATETLDNVHSSLSNPANLDFSDHASKQANANEWLFASIVLLLVSAICQMIVLLR